MGLKSPCSSGVLSTVPAPHGWEGHRGSCVPAVSSWCRRFLGAFCAGCAQCSSGGASCMPRAGPDQEEGMCECALCAFASCLNLMLAFGFQDEAQDFFACPKDA